METKINEESFEELNTAVHEKGLKVPPQEPEAVWKVILDYLIYIIIVIGCCLLFVKFIAVRSIVDGHSMNPTLNDKDNLIVEKVSYYLHEPRRFDVIVFELTSEPGVHYIKRIIGLPGETVQVKEGSVYINGTKLESDIYGNEPMLNAYAAAEPIILGTDQYFVLGDNRNHSKDSRSVDPGPIHKSQFLGKALFRFWPIWKFKFITH